MTATPLRVRAEKMKEIDGEMRRWCPYCKTYLPLKDFRLRKARAGLKESSESAKYQSDCTPCSTLRMAESRARRRSAAAAVKS